MNNISIAAEFESFKSSAQLLADAGNSVVAGNVDQGLQSLNSLIANLEREIPYIRDPDIKEAQQMMAEVARELIGLVTGSELTDELKKKKVLQYERLNANLQSKIMVVVTKVNASQNPSMGNRFSVWISKLVDRFRV